LEDTLGPVQVLEAFGPVSALVVVKPEVGVAVSKLRVIVAQDLLLDDDTLRLQLDGLQEVAHLVLDVGHLGDARGDLRVHSAGDLEQKIDNLVVEIECLLILALTARCDGFLHHLRGVLVLIVQMLHNWEEVSHNAPVEGHILVCVELLVTQQEKLLLLCLLLFLLDLFLIIRCSLVLNFGGNKLSQLRGIVLENELSVAVEVELETDAQTEVTKH